MARWIFLLLCLMESLASDSDSVCPRQCDCKWKRGKESVFCSQTGFYQVPKLFYTGTQVANPFFFSKKNKKTLTFGCFSILFRRKWGCKTSNCTHHSKQTQTASDFPIHFADILLCGAPTYLSFQKYVPISVQQ